MKVFKRFAGIAVSITGLCLGAVVNAEDFKPILTEGEFQELVVGKRMYLNDNYVTVEKNGRVEGKFGGKQLKGAWEWRDQYWCRTLTTHSKDTDCQTWSVNGNQFLVTRERGKGKAFTYTTK